MARHATLLHITRMTRSGGDSCISGAVSNSHPIYWDAKTATGQTRSQSMKAWTGLTSVTLTITRLWQPHSCCTLEAVHSNTHHTATEVNAFVFSHHSAASSNAIFCSSTNILDSTPPIKLKFMGHGCSVANKKVLESQIQNYNPNAVFAQIH